jgi:capsular polysaccharide biosynthesis protein
VLPDGALSTESTYHHLYGDWAFTEALRLGKRERLVEGNHYSLLNRFASGHNYYHWLHDVVIPLHDVLDQLPSDTRFVVPPGLRGFQEESLAVAGLVGDQRLLEFDGGEVVRFENLYFAPPTGLTLDHPEADLWFRDKALDSYRLDRGRPFRNIYISRRGARYRRVVNEDEILAVLHRYDFEVYQLEDCSFRDQVTLFAEAAMVISAHGAGLTNMIFSPPGLLVFDIFESKRFSKYFWNMTAALGHSYWPMLGIPVPIGRSYASDSALPADVALPADLLKRVIERAVGEVRAG